MRAAIIYFRLLYARALIYVIGSIFTSILGALQACNWEELTGTAKTCVICSIGATVCLVVGAYMDKTAGQLRKIDPQLPELDLSPESVNNNSNNSKTT